MSVLFPRNWKPKPEESSSPWMRTHRRVSLICYIYVVAKFYRLFKFYFIFCFKLIRIHYHTPPKKETKFTWPRRLNWTTTYTLYICVKEGKSTLISLGIIRHYDQNFSYIFLWKHCQHNLHFLARIAAQNCHSLIMQPRFFGPIQVLRSQFEFVIIVNCCHFLGTVTSFLRDSKHAHNSR